MQFSVENFWRCRTAKKIQTQSLTNGFPPFSTKNISVVFVLFAETRRSTVCLVMAASFKHYRPACEIGKRLP